MESVDRSSSRFTRRESVRLLALAVALLLFIPTMMAVIVCMILAAIPIVGVPFRWLLDRLGLRRR
jgi:cell division protein FtsW (lipid II flippase)